MIDNTELTAGRLHSHSLKPRKVIRVCGMLAQYCVFGTISKLGNVVVMAAWIFLLYLHSYICFSSRSVSGLLVHRKVLQAGVHLETEDATCTLYSDM